MSIISVLSTPEILESIEDLKHDKEKIEQFLKNMSAQGEEKYTQEFYDLVDKIVKTNYTNIIEELSNKNARCLAKVNGLKKSMRSINITDLDSLVPKIREYIETNLNLLNISKFTEQYNEYLSKINETQDKLLSSMDLEKIKEYKLFLSNIYDEISNLTILIKEKLDQSNITSTLKIQIQEIVESIKNKTDNFHKEEILQMISELKELIKNTSLYAEVEPLLKQMEERNKELISKLNETGLADEFTKVFASIKNLENLFKNRTELMEKINTRISQVDLADLSTRLNLSLTNIKKEIIGNLKNTTELKEKRNELKNKIFAQ